METLADGYFHTLVSSASLRRRRAKNGKYLSVCLLACRIHTKPLVEDLLQGGDTPGRGVVR
jgi:hypothetical protein